MSKPEMLSRYKRKRPAVSCHNPAFYQAVNRFPISRKRARNRTGHFRTTSSEIDKTLRSLASPEIHQPRPANAAQQTAVIWPVCLGLASSPAPGQGQGSRVYKRGGGGGGANFLQPRLSTRLNKLPQANSKRNNSLAFICCILFSPSFLNKEKFDDSALRYVLACFPHSLLAK